MPDSLICVWEGVVIPMNPLEWSCGDPVPPPLPVDPSETFTLVPDPMDRIRDIYWNGYPVDPDNPTIVGGE